MQLASYMQSGVWQVRLCLCMRIHLNSDKHVLALGHRVLLSTLRAMMSEPTIIVLALAPTVIDAADTVRSSGVRMLPVFLALLCIVYHAAS